MKGNDVMTIDEFEGKKLLKQYGIDAIEEFLCHDAASACAAAEKLGHPVAAKVCSADILHKTETKGVILNIADSGEMKKAAMELSERFPGRNLLIQKMARKGIELIIGARSDPVYGPVILAGFGGIFTEVFRDTSIELAPIDKKTAMKMLQSLRGASLLMGFRGHEGADVEKIASCLIGISNLMMEREDISEIDINPLIATSERAVAVDALIRLNGSPAGKKKKASDSRTVDPFFNPEKVALIGASRSHGKGGNIILRNTIKAGFRGELIPVNPSVNEILGLKAYKSVRDIPGPVDLAMIVIPKTAVKEAISDCEAKGVKAVILSTGGYSDIGHAGTLEQEEIVEQTKKAGIRLMGPNSIGTINPASGLATSIVGLEPIMPGGVSLIGQSGVFSSGWGRWIADMKPFGISKIACIGNKGDINECDLIEYMATDEKTTTLGMYLEGVIDGERFIRASLKASSKKPVVVVKSGKTEAGAQAIASHTGSLAGSDEVFNAVCRRTGLIRTPDSESFFDTLAAFEALPLPRGNRMGVLSITGMGCVVTTDACDEHGIELPELRPETLKRLGEVMPSWAPVRNPVDIWSATEQHGSKKTMSHIASCLLDQKDIDAVMIIFVLMPETIYDIEEAFGDIIRAHPHKPVFATYYGGTEKEARHVHEGFMKLGVPSYPTPERAIYAFSCMVRYARFKGLIK